MQPSYAWMTIYVIAVELSNHANESSRQP
ncbi:hypothetical protein XAB3213_540022 [Xanthomonas citri pv. bilvae]|nr:hypothetical protein XAB3213_540022 [Xanthomonas citri pv. bilvae]